MVCYGLFLFFETFSLFHIQEFMLYIQELMLIFRSLCLYLGAYDQYLGVYAYIFRSLCYLSGFQSCFATKNVCVLCWRQYEPFQAKEVLSQAFGCSAKIPIMVCYGLFLFLKLVHYSKFRSLCFIFRSLCSYLGAYAEYLGVYDYIFRSLCYLSDSQRSFRS